MVDGAGTANRRFAWPSSTGSRWAGRGRRNRRDSRRSGSSRRKGRSDQGRRRDEIGAEVCRGKTESDTNCSVQTAIAAGIIRIAGSEGRMGRIKGGSREEKHRGRGELGKEKRDSDRIVFLHDFSLSDHSESEYI